MYLATVNDELLITVELAPLALLLIFLRLIARHHVRRGARRLPRFPSLESYRKQLYTFTANTKTCYK